MDIFFSDLGEVPLPPDEVRIRGLQAHSLGDGKRFRIQVELDPSQKRPSIDLEVKDAGNDAVLYTTSIVDSISRSVEVIVHLPGRTIQGPYSVTASLYFVEVPEIKTKSGMMLSDDGEMEQDIPQQPDLDAAEYLNPPEVKDTKTIIFSRE